MKDYEKRIMENFELSLIELKGFEDKNVIVELDYKDINNLIEYVKMAGVYYADIKRNNGDDKDYFKMVLLRFVNDIHSLPCLTFHETAILFFLIEHEIRIVDRLIRELSVNN